MFAGKTLILCAVYLLVQKNTDALPIRRQQPGEPPLDRFTTNNFNPTFTTTTSNPPGFNPPTNFDRNSFDPNSFNNNGFVAPPNGFNSNGFESNNGFNTNQFNPNGQVNNQFDPNGFNSGAPSNSFNTGFNNNGFSNNGFNNNDFNNNGFNNGFNNNGINNGINNPGSFPGAAPMPPMLEEVTIDPTVDNNADREGISVSSDESVPAERTEADDAADLPLGIDLGGAPQNLANVDKAVMELEEYSIAYPDAVFPNEQSGQRLLPGEYLSGPCDSRLTLEDDGVLTLTGPATTEDGERVVFDQFLGAGIACQGGEHCQLKFGDGTITIGEYRRGVPVRQVFSAQVRTPAVAAVLLANGDLQLVDEEGRNVYSFQLRVTEQTYYLDNARNNKFSTYPITPLSSITTVDSQIGFRI